MAKTQKNLLSQVQWLTQNNDDWAISCVSFQGHIDNHYPPDKLIQFFFKTPIIFPRLTKWNPIEGAALVFTDGSCSSVAAYSIDGKIFYFHTSRSTTQIVELLAIIKVLQVLSQQAFNLYTDSSYIALSVPCLETSPYIHPTTNAAPLFAILQSLILDCSCLAPVSV